MAVIVRQIQIAITQPKDAKIKFAKKFMDCLMAMFAQKILIVLKHTATA
jgi:hypothetical protein